MKNDDFFRPIWLRLGIVVACAGWAVFEWVNGETGWAMMAGAVTLYGVWSFLIAYKPSEDAGDQKTGKTEDDAH